MIVYLEKLWDADLSSEERRNKVKLIFNKIIDAFIELFDNKPVGLPLYFTAVFNAYILTTLFPTNPRAKALTLHTLTDLLLARREREKNQPPAYTA